MKRSALAELPEEAVSHNAAIRKRVLLRKGDLPRLTNFSQARFPPGQRAAGHRHEDMSEVFFVEAGRGAIRVDGNEYALSPGVCVAVEAREIHEIENTGSEELVISYFGLESE